MGGVPQGTSWGDWLIRADQRVPHMSYRVDAENRWVFISDATDWTIKQTNAAWREFLRVFPGPTRVGRLDPNRPPFSRALLREAAGDPEIAPWNDPELMPAPNVVSLDYYRYR